jgi:hypothetical protein
VLLAPERRGERRSGFELAQEHQIQSARGSTTFDNIVETTVEKVNV